MKALREIRNIKNHLVGKYDPNTATLMILIKGYLTTIRFLSDGEIEITNSNPQSN